ncbi:MAG: molybdopterin molybdotransferase MoeA [Chloroflexi bacterium]|nr:molybdopterin molybdotransferase MoeA [Chloroflexota bacterium]
MPEFLHLLPPDEALALLLRSLPDPRPVAETVGTLRSLGRVTAADVRSPHPLPEFPRSTVDGYAVRAADTFGASDSLPAYLTLIGEVPMGAAPDLEIAPAQTAVIHTGGMLPPGADAVVMLEYTQVVNRGEHGEKESKGSVVEIEVSRAVANGENVIRVGEDVAEGQVILPKGSLIRPAEIGGLMALGFTRVAAVRRPRVGIISSGDEVVPPEQRPGAGQVRDINSYTLAALVTRTGGEPVLYGIIPDEMDVMKGTAAKALSECDLLLITAGSSASARDMTAEAIDALGEPGVLVHGVNTRPGKPTILGACDGKAVIGLPGNPVSALVNGYVFVAPLVRRLLGQGAESLRPSVSARLTVNIPSQAGREDWIPVRLTTEHTKDTEKKQKEISANSVISVVNSSGARYLAEPIFGKSNLIFTLVAADGLLKIPPDATGLSAGEMVEVMLI